MLRSPFNTTNFDFRTHLSEWLFIPSGKYLCWLIWNYAAKICCHFPLSIWRCWQSWILFWNLFGWHSWDSMFTCNIWFEVIVHFSLNPGTVQTHLCLVCLHHFLSGHFGSSSLPSPFSSSLINITKVCWTILGFDSFSLPLFSTDKCSNSRSNYCQYLNFNLWWVFPRDGIHWQEELSITMSFEDD